MVAKRVSVLFTQLFSLFLPPFSLSLPSLPPSSYETQLPALCSTKECSWSSPVRTSSESSFFSPVASRFYLPREIMSTSAVHLCAPPSMWVLSRCFHVVLLSFVTSIAYPSFTLPVGQDHCNKLKCEEGETAIIFDCGSSN